MRSNRESRRARDWRMRLQGIFWTILAWLAGYYGAAALIGG